MPKIDSFPFDPDSWLGGTSTFTRAQKGAYLDLLIAQFKTGHLSIVDIKDILGEDFEKMWMPKLKAKFRLDSEQKYYNVRLDKEISKVKNLIAIKEGTYKEPKQFLKDNKPIDLEQLNMTSLMPKDEFDRALEQWSLKCEENNWAYSGEEIEDLKRLWAGFKKWLNTWNENNKTGKFNHGKQTRKTGHDFSDIEGAARAILRGNKSNRDSGMPEG